MKEVFRLAGDIVSQLDPIFKPRSVAVVGASDDREKWGHATFEKAHSTGFRGPVYPVNREQETVQGFRAYPSIKDVPDQVDLAVIVVPARFVPGVMRDCVEAGVRGAVVISAGFAETGPEGRRLQQEIVQIARDGGIRFVGPNCMGIFSSVSKINLAFGGMPPHGPIAFVSQSGTLGGYLFQAALTKGYGFSKFISSGNQADLNVADYLEYLGQDPDTGGIVLYLEGVPEGRRFLEVAKRVTREKPVIVYKGGRTSVGMKATMSHTGSLAGVDAIFEAVCRQAGILRGYEAMHPFDMVEAIASQPLPAGPRVAIIINGGGHTVTMGDACALAGLQVPDIDPETQADLRKYLWPHAPDPVNPIDTAGDWRPMTISLLADRVASLDYIDGLIVQPPWSSPGRYKNAELAKAAINAAEIIANIPGKYGKPVITISSRDGVSGMIGDILSGGKIPGYSTPEECARAMYALVKYAEIRRRSQIEPRLTASMSGGNGKEENR